MTVSRRKLKSGTCRVCGCTYDDPCPEGCGWANVEQTLCTSLVCQLTNALAYVERVGFTKGARAFAKRVLRRARKEARR